MAAIKWAKNLWLEARAHYFGTRHFIYIIGRVFGEFLHWVDFSWRRLCMMTIRYLVLLCNSKQYQSCQRWPPTYSGCFFFHLGNNLSKIHVANFWSSHDSHHQTSRSNSLPVPRRHQSVPTASTSSDVVDSRIFQQRNKTFPFGAWRNRILLSTRESPERLPTFT